MSSLIIEDLVARRCGSILAIDADPNSTLSDSLGVKNPETIVGIVEDIAKNIDRIPSGITKDRFIEMRIQEIIAEENGYDLLVMGRPEGPGCYCYVNSLLRDMISRITRSYDFIVIDNAAGMEHISRRTARVIDKLVLVSDCSAVGVRSAKRIYDLVKELGIKMQEAFLVVNKVRDSTEDLGGEIEKTLLHFAGVIPHSGEVEKLSILNRPLSELEDKAIRQAIEAISKNLIKGETKICR